MYTNSVVICYYITQEMQIYATSGNEARLKVLEDTDMLAIGLSSQGTYVCSCAVMLMALFTGWMYSSDDSILPRPPQCCEGSPPGRGQHQHHLTGEVLFITGSSVL